jgi:hypothetical protein
MSPTSTSDNAAPTVAARARLEFLRHTIATLAYRAAKVIRTAPTGFADVRAGETTRPAGQILAHMGDLIDWAIGMTEGKSQWHDSTPLPWDDEVRRFFSAMTALDERLAKQPSASVTLEKIFQGPIADALWHTGQLATLRRLAGAGIKGESYYRADIQIGRAGLDQAAPNFEFE